MICVLIHPLTIVSCVTSVIVCEALELLEDGNVTYSVGEGDPLVFGTIATYSCDIGYSLLGVEIQTCEGNGSSVTGGWNGTEPTCLCRLFLHFVSVHREG